MFTGLVEEIGTIARVEQRGRDARIEVRAKFRDYVLGESIAVDGVCLSVTQWHESGFCADASAETLAKTTLGGLRAGCEVHLERALSVGARLGGHIVTGHVDGVGTIVSKEHQGAALSVRFEVPPELAPFLAPKGSVAVDGTSLTVNGAVGRRFDVILVPITQTKTVLARKRPGDRVNLEVDVLAKYVARLLGRPGVDGVDPAASNEDGGIDESWLAERGYR